MTMEGEGEGSRVALLGALLFAETAVGRCCQGAVGREPRLSVAHAHLEISKHAASTVAGLSTVWLTTTLAPLVKVDLLPQAVTASLPEANARSCDLMRCLLELSRALGDEDVAHVCEEWLARREALLRMLDAALEPRRRLPP